MLLVIATLPGKPESRAELSALLATMAAASRTEPGCRSYAFHVDVEDPDRFVSVETWDDKAALDAHMAGPAMREHGGALLGMLAGEPDIALHELP